MGQCTPVTDDLFNARTRRRVAHSPYAPIEQVEDDVARLRTDVLARLLVERLNSLGPMTETEAVDVLDMRAPGRGADVVSYSIRVGLVRRSQHDSEPTTLEAIGTPRSLAA
jgi:hypothetical protein